MKIPKIGNGRWQLHVFFRLPKKGVGYYRWSVTLAGRMFGWVNRGGILDGYFSTHVVGSWGNTSWYWPTPRTLRVGRLAHLKWWQPWRGRDW